MTYKEAMDFLQSIQPKGIVPGLDTMRELLRRLGSPEDSLKFIHIAGTNGKGSTGAFLSSVLKCAGYKTGHYSSPAVFSEEECFRVDGEPISKERFSDCVGRIAAVSREMEAYGWNHPTLFEIETALAFLYFKEEACELVVLETGMGGREDATNVVKNVVCTVFTAISLDHTHFLGDTLEEIAFQKAGIMKQETPAVTDLQAPEVLKVLEDEAYHKNVPLRIAYTDRARSLSMGNVLTDEAVQMFEYKVHKNMVLSLLGTYQIVNACVAIEVCELLEDWGYRITERQIRQGLLQAKMKGRLEVIAKDPVILIDGAHNPAAAKRLKESLDTYYPDEKKIYIMGVLADKDYEGVIKETIDGADYIYTITPENKRALSAELLKESIEKQGMERVEAADLKTALAEAKRQAGTDGMIVAFGSFTFLKELKLLVDQENEKTWMKIK